ncbi:hypothetical protein A5758_21770 [Mycobacterium sp. 852014-50255_SCH5639931]|nr:hypothetical protein A5758_21770 [Mycobacterium sp. 852014-50255_SCH5639931]
MRAALQWSYRVVNGESFDLTQAEHVALLCSWVRTLTRNADDVEQFLARQLAFATEELMVSLMARCADVDDVLKGDLVADIARWREAVDDFSAELAFDG